MVFGYMNQNWLEEFDIPIGPDNNIEPGGPDRGQPTHFYPRRSPFLFTIKRAEGLRRQGARLDAQDAREDRERAYASLKNDYMIDNQVISTEVGGDFGSLRDELRTNIPPELKVDGDKRRTRQGRRAADADGVRQGSRQHSRRDADEARRRRRRSPPRAPLYRAPSSLVPASGPGLRLSWIVYRGNAADVTFSPDQMKTWTDTRAYANSPWSPPYFIPEPPPDNKWIVQATFKEPGTYVLRAVASDGAVFTYDNVTVTVTR